MEKHKVRLPSLPGNEDKAQPLNLLSFLEKKKKG
jgi:hypothetical protein